MKKEHKQLLVGFTLAVFGTVLMILAFPSPLGFLFAPFAGVGGTMMIEPLCVLASESRIGKWMMTDE